MCLCVVFFFFNDTATTEIYTLSLHDALPISPERAQQGLMFVSDLPETMGMVFPLPAARVETMWRSEEHTSELQSHSDLVCRLLLEKKKNIEKLNQSHITNHAKPSNTSSIIV